MHIERLGAAAMALALTVFASGARAAIYNVDCGAGTVSGAATASATPTTILGMVLGTPSALASVHPPPAPGDIIKITSMCEQDVLVTTSGLTITNPGGPNNSYSYLDGVNGQLEIAGATGVVIDGIGLGVFQNQAFFGSPNDVALLYAHDGAAVTLTTHARAGNSTRLGVLAARSSKVEMIDGAVVSLNGFAGADQAPRDNGGIQARDNSAIVLGTGDGLNPVQITDNFADAVAAYRNSSIVIYGAQFSGNADHQIVVMSASSAHLSLSSTSITAPAGAPNAIQAVGTSTVQIDGGVTVAGAPGAEAVSLLGGSALLLQGSQVSAPGSGPVIEASSGSIIALAGGNTICSGTLSGTACTPAPGIAIEIDHVASLVQISGADFGYAAAADTVTGAGAALLQSTVDLGLGLINSSPSMSWTTGSGGINVAQNSSFRLQGGATITGNLAIGQSSNGFFNKTKGAANAVTRILCPWTVIPAAHVVAGSIGVVTPLPTLSANFLSTAKNQCLSF